MGFGVSRVVRVIKQQREEDITNWQNDHLFEIVLEEVLNMDALAESIREEQNTPQNALRNSLTRITHVLGRSSSPPLLLRSFHEEEKKNPPPEDLSCVICLNNFTGGNPRYTLAECKHTFCMNCLLEHINSNKFGVSIKNIKCPADFCTCKIRDATTFWKKHLNKSR